MEYLDIVPLLSDAEIYKEITNIFVKEISNKTYNILYHQNLEDFSLDVQ